MVGVNPVITEQNRRIRETQMLIDLNVINFDIRFRLKIVKHRFHYSSIFWASITPERLRLSAAN